MTRRQVILVAAICAVFIGASATLITIINRNEHRYATAQAALPDAQRFLNSEPRYKTINVAVSDYEGGGLWFTGDLPTQAECDELERTLSKRYHSSDFIFMYTVLSSSGK